LNLKPKPNQTKPKPKKIRKNRAKPDKNRAKPEKTKPNWFELVFVLKNQTEIGWFEPVLVFFFKKIWFDYFFFIKTKSN